MSRYTVQFDAGDDDCIPGYIVVDSLTGTIVEKCWDDEVTAKELCEYYNSMEQDADHVLEIDEFDEYDGQPDELTEWMDFDPDC